MKCAAHSDVDAVGFCRNCGKALCSECAREVGGALYCESCLAAAVSGRSQAATAPTVSDSNPATAAALGLIPGLGAVYNGEYTKAMMHLAIWGGLFAIGLTGSLGDLTPLAWIAFGLFPLYMSIDAYRVAKARRSSPAVGVDTKFPAAPHRMPVGAMVLIAIGALALLGNFGVLQGEWIDKGWPLILIFLGVWLIARQSRPGS